VAFGQHHQPRLQEAGRPERVVVAQHDVDVVVGDSHAIGAGDPDVDVLVGFVEHVAEQRHREPRDLLPGRPLQPELRDRCVARRSRRRR
jgi:hypothetical protein